MEHEVKAQQTKHWDGNLHAWNGIQVNGCIVKRAFKLCGINPSITAGQALALGRTWDPPALEQVQVTAGIFTSAVCCTADMFV